MGKLTGKPMAELQGTFAANPSIPKAWVLPDGTWRFSEVFALKAVGNDPAKLAELEVIENKRYVNPAEPAPAAEATDEEDKDDE